jgi:putative Holliday junction resolvase
MPTRLALPLRKSRVWLAKKTACLRLSRVRKFAQELARLTALPVTLQDERLTSREAESRLALREKDWRARKARLDAAAAAIILQDFLDTR